MANSPVYNTLTIAGIDPSGGAGVLADVKVMSALGTYATAVVAALTAQNTCAVTAIEPVSPRFVTEQIDTLFSDVRIDAVKIGMVGGGPVIEAVAAGLRRWKPRWVVLDTVMVAKSGDRLLADDALEAMKTQLLTQAHIMTPNLPEASVLLGREVCCADHMPQAARDLYALSGGHCAVYLKGGHLQQQDSPDLFYDGRSFVTLNAPRVVTKNTHGTGCSLSSALAALLPQCNDMHEAAQRAKQYISQAIAHADALDVGHGHGPIHHFYALWDKN